MEKWEYISVKFLTKGFSGGILDIHNLDRELNSLGEQGWELVSCITTHMSAGQSREVIAVLKRRK
jgi:hypothetical protein